MEKFSQELSDFPKGKTRISFALDKSRILIKFWANQKWKEKRNQKSFLKVSF